MSQDKPLVLWVEPANYSPDVITAAPDGFDAIVHKTHFYPSLKVIDYKTHALAIETLRILWQTADTEHLSDELKEQVKKVLGE
jgi:hypothetical protein